MLIALIISLAFVAVHGQMGNGGVKQMCDQRAKNGMGMEKQKCETFMECCRTECSVMGQSAEINRCQGLFYFSAKKECMCSGGANNPFNGNGNNPFNPNGNNNGNNPFNPNGNGNNPFNGNGNNPFNGNGNNPFNGNGNNPFNGNGNNPFNRNGGNNGNGIKGQCNRQAENSFGSDSQKCREFISCCQMKCEQRGKMPEDSYCQGFPFNSAEKRCRCGRRNRNGGGGNRNRNGGGNRNRNGGGGIRKCVRRGEQFPGAANQKCEEYISCCREHCRERGEQVEEAECAGFMYSSAQKSCRCGNNGGNPFGATRG